MTLEDDKHSAINPFTTQERISFERQIIYSDFVGLYVTALCTGMRLGELLCLQWQDVGFGQITVRRVAQHRFGQLTVMPVRRRRVMRYSADDEVANALHHQFDQNDRWRSTHGIEFNPDSLVFTTASGQMIDVTAIRQDFQDRLTFAGIGLDHTIYDLRHTYAITALTSGEASLRDLQIHLGHASIERTVAHYGQWASTAGYEPHGR